MSSKKTKTKKNDALSTELYKMSRQTQNKKM